MRTPEVGALEPEQVARLLLSLWHSKPDDVVSGCGILAGWAALDDKIGADALGDLGLILSRAAKVLDTISAEAEAEED